jgi:hypothetical protein
MYWYIGEATPAPAAGELREKRRAQAHRIAVIQDSLALAALVRNTQQRLFLFIDFRSVPIVCAWCAWHLLPSSLPARGA